MTEHTEVHERRGISLALIVIIVLFLAGVAGAAAYYFFVQKPLQQQLADSQDMMMRLSGLDHPVGNRLDPRYSDVNGTLVADPPTDPSQLIDPPKLTFSYIPTDDSTDFKAAFADLMKHISVATGKPVEYLDSSSTDDQLYALRDGRLDITFLNTGNVPLGVCTAGFVPIACPGDDNGIGKYEMQILVRAESPIQTVLDLRGHELTLTDPTSNSGYKAPLVLIRTQYGLLPGRDYGIRYSHGHEQSIKGLADGTYEVAAVASDVLSRQIAAGVIKPTQYRTIYTSESFPTAAIGIAYNLKPDLADKIRQAILNFDWKGTTVEPFFASAGRTKFVAVEYKDDWALIRSIDDSCGTMYELK